MTLKAYTLRKTSTSLPAMQTDKEENNMIYTCEKAFRDGKEIREEVDIYLDINQYKPHSFDTPKNDKAYPPQHIEEMFTGIPYFFYKQGFDFSDCIGLARVFYAFHGWMFPVEDIHNMAVGGRGLTRLWDKHGEYFDDISPDSLEYGDLIILPPAGLYIFLGWNEGKAVTLGYPSTTWCILTESTFINLDLTKEHKYIKPICLHRKPIYCEPYRLSKDDEQFICLNRQYNPYMVEDTRLLDTYTPEKQNELMHNALAFRGYDLYHRISIIGDLRMNAARRPKQ